MECFNALKVNCKRPKPLTLSMHRFKLTLYSEFCSLSMCNLIENNLFLINYLYNLTVDL